MTLLRFLDVAGVAVFAISGALAAMRKRLDPIGILVIATVTATGGGTLRDLLIDRQPFWVTDPTYLAVIIASAIVTIIYVRFGSPPDRGLSIADAMGLGLFTISGAKIAEQSQLAGLIVVVMGTITGIFGGIIRDVLCAEVPMVFRKNTLYATAAMIGASIYVLMPAQIMDRNSAATIAIAVIIGIRLAAIYWGITLPVFPVDQSGEGK
ncbi:MAG TPA: trimeric intracellular cation channel family protein [Burkholderiales bacterium]|nr:trimeric intracellular cation channel family protein [Burkholderiales bacterium]